MIDGNKLENIAASLTLSALGYALYRVNGETPGDQVYNIPGYGEMCFCGLQGTRVTYHKKTKIFVVILIYFQLYFIKKGVVSIVYEIRKNNNLGHALCNNLREGDWLMDYISSRLIRNEPTKLVGFINLFCLEI